MALRQFIIQREIPAVGTLEREELRGAAAKSNEALRQTGPDIQWVERYVAADKTVCVYLATDEAVPGPQFARELGTRIRRHADISGFPATTFADVRKTIDPTTERRD